MFGGFRERAEYTYQLLRAPGTSFLVIAAPEPDALREASYFVERLAVEEMPLAGLILNRMQRSPAARLSAARSMAAAESLQPGEGPNGDGADSDGPDGDTRRDEPQGWPAQPGQAPYRLAIAALRLHAERMQLVAAQRRLTEHFTAAHPLVPVTEVPAQAEDVHNLAGLRAIGESFLIG